MIWIYTITFFLFELIGVTFLKSHTFYPDFRIGVPFKFAKENEVIWGMANAFAGSHLINQGVVYAIGVFLMVFSKATFSSYLLFEIFFWVYTIYCAATLKLYVKGRIKKTLNENNGSIEKGENHA
jgi:hypothetical protein